MKSIKLTKKMAEALIFIFVSQKTTCTNKITLSALKYHSLIINDSITTYAVMLLLKQHKKLLQSQNEYLGSATEFIERIHENHVYYEALANTYMRTISYNDNYEYYKIKNEIGYIFGHVLAGNITIAIAKGCSDRFVITNKGCDNLLANSPLYVKEQLADIENYVLEYYTILYREKIELKLAMLKEEALNNNAIKRFADYMENIIEKSKSSHKNA